MLPAKRCKGKKAVSSANAALLSVVACAGAAVVFARGHFPALYSHLRGEASKVEVVSRKNVQMVFSFIVVDLSGRKNLLSYYSFFNTSSCMSP